MRIELRRNRLECAKYAANMNYFRTIDVMSFKLCGIVVDNVKLVLSHFGANCAIIAALGYNLKTTCAIVTKLGKWMNDSLLKRWASFLFQMRLFVLSLSLFSIGTGNLHPSVRGASSGPPKRRPQVFNDRRMPISQTQSLCDSIVISF